jgi:hypothetical protein
MSENPPQASQLAVVAGPRLHQLIADGQHLSVISDVINRHNELLNELDEAGAYIFSFHFPQPPNCVSQTLIIIIP